MILNICPEVRLLDHIVILCLIFEGTAIIFSKMAAILQSHLLATEFQFLPIRIDTYFLVFDNNHPNGWEVISYWGFNLHFSNDERCSLAYLFEDRECWDNSEGLFLQPGLTQQKKGYLPESEWMMLETQEDDVGRYDTMIFKLSLSHYRLTEKCWGRKKNYSKPTHFYSSLDWISQDCSSNTAVHTTGLVLIMYVI